MKFRAMLIAISVLLIAPIAFAQPGEWSQSRLEAYKNDAEAVESTSLQYARAHGKQAQNQRFRDVINRYPGGSRSVYLETRIALVHGWDLSEQGEPPDIPQKVKTFDSFMNRYDPNEPYMKTAMKLSANCSMDLYPRRSKRLYKSIMKTYPDDDAMRLDAYVHLGRLAERRGRFEKADDYFSRVMTYEAKSKESWKDRRAINHARHNAAVSLFWLAFGANQDESSKAQLAAVKNMLERYPVIEISYMGDTVHRIMKQLERQVVAEESRTTN